MVYISVNFHALLLFPLLQMTYVPNKFLLVYSIPFPPNSPPQAPTSFLINSPLCNDPCCRLAPPPFSGSRLWFGHGGRPLSSSCSSSFHYNLLPRKLSQAKNTFLTLPLASFTWLMSHFPSLPSVPLHVDQDNHAQLSHSPSSPTFLPNMTCYMSKSPLLRYALNSLFPPLRHGPSAGSRLLRFGLTRVLLDPLMVHLAVQVAP